MIFLFDSFYIFVSIFRRRIMGNNFPFPKLHMGINVLHECYIMRGKFHDT